MTIEHKLTGLCAVPGTRVHRITAFDLDPVPESVEAWADVITGHLSDCPVHDCDTSVQPYFAHVRVTDDVVEFVVLVGGDSVPGFEAPSRLSKKRLEQE